jgi:hypothetical protein
MGRHRPFAFDSPWLNWFQTADAISHTFASRGRDAPELCKNLPPGGGRGAPPKQGRDATLKQGRGECRVPDAPAAPVQKVKAQGSHHGCTGTPGIPARNGFNGLYRALPGDEFVLSPSLAN